MKNLKELLSQEPVFLGEFNCAEDVFSNFQINGEGINILFAWYDTPPYEGYAYVLFEKDGVLYEVQGSHCSCYGLENQWEPYTAELVGMEYIANNGRLYDDNFKRFLGIK